MRNISQTTQKSKSVHTLDFANSIEAHTPHIPMRDILTVTTLPVVLQHLEPLIAKLPLHVLVTLSAGAIQHGLDDDQFEQALHDAVAFQAQPAHRCGACFRWVDPPFFSLAMVGCGRVVFAAACRRCEKRIDRGQVTPTMRRNLESLIDDELAGGEK